VTKISVTTGKNKYSVCAVAVCGSIRGVMKLKSHVA